MSQKRKEKFKYLGGEYEGECISGKVPHGKGIIRFGNGDSYVGDWKTGVCSGKGKMIGKIDGKDFTYEGEMKNFQMEGQGCFTHSNGEVYDGFWKMSTMHGMGMYRWPNMDLYQGEFINNQRNGFGTYQSMDAGILYSGHWKEDQRHGKGVETLTGKGKYEGYWIKGNKHGTFSFTDTQRRKSSSSKDSKTTATVYTLQTYQDGKLMEERSVDKPPVLVPPKELSEITEEDEIELLKGEVITDTDKDIMRVFIDGMILWKDKTWTSVEDSYVELLETKMELDFQNGKRGKDLLPKLKELKKEIVDKIYVLDNCPTDSAYSMKRALDELDQPCKDDEFESVKKAFDEVYANLKEQLEQAETKVKQAEKLEVLIREVEKKLFRAKNGVESARQMLKNLEATTTIDIDKKSELYQELLTEITNHFEKIRKIQQKSFKMAKQGSSEKEMSKIDDILEKYSSEFYTFVSNRHKQLQTGKMDPDALSRRSKSLTTLVQKQRKKNSQFLDKFREMQQQNNATSTITN